MSKMEAWRQVNIELRALYEEDITFGTWQFLWERWFQGNRSAEPRTVARWYVADLHAQ